MKKLTTTSIVFLICSCLVFAQQRRTSTTRTNRAQANTPAQPALPPQFSQVTLKGKVIDIKTLKPIEFASVFLTDSVGLKNLMGTMTDTAGYFTLDRVPVGKNYFKVSSLSYALYEKTITIKGDKQLNQVGFVRLEPSEEQLEEVVVKGEGSFFSMQADKRVFSADKLEMAEGGTAADLMRQIPILDVDIDDNVQLRGKQILVTIDGRPSPFPDVNAVMQMLPADIIERVEVITNPSSKFEARGGGGVINIVLKKSRAKGYNGLASVNLSSLDYYRAGLNFNLRRGRLNWTFLGDLRYNESQQKTQTNRWNYRQDTVYYSEKQRAGIKSYSSNKIGKIGLDYFYDDKTTYSISQTLTNPYSNSIDIMDGKSFYVRGTARDVTNRDNRNFSENLTYVTDLNYRKVYREDVPHEFTIDFQMSFNDLDREYSSITRYYNPTTLLKNRNPYDQMRLYDRRTSKYYAKADYLHPIGKTGKWETGVSSITNTNKTKTDASVMQYVPGDTSYKYNRRLSEDFEYLEEVAAGYFEYANTLKKFGYKLGGRSEYSYVSGLSKLDTIDFKKTYFYLFPAAFITYKLPDNQTIGASYSTRINRPNFWDMMPFIDDSDPNNYRLGNPQLKPAYTHNAEMTYNIYNPKTRSNFSCDVFYSYTSDIIQRITYTDSLSKFITISQGIRDTVTNISRSENSGNQQQFGSTVVYRMRAGATTLTTTLTGYYEIMKGHIGRLEYQKDGFSGKVQLNGQYTFSTTGTSVNIVGTFETPRISAQGMYRPVRGLDMSVRQQFLDRKLRLTLILEDVFNTVRYQSDTRTTAYRSEFDRKADTRALRLSLSYRFGKMDTEVEKRKSRRTQDVPQEALQGAQTLIQQQQQLKQQQQNNTPKPTVPGPANPEPTGGDTPR